MFNASSTSLAERGIGTLLYLTVALPDAVYFPASLGDINPVPPNDAVQKQKKKIHRIFSVQYYHNSKNIIPLATYNFII